MNIQNAIDGLEAQNAELEQVKAVLVAESVDPFKREPGAQDQYAAVIAGIDGEIKANTKQLGKLRETIRHAEGMGVDPGKLELADKSRVSEADIEGVKSRLVGVLAGRGNPELIQRIEAAYDKKNYQVTREGLDHA